MISLEPGKTTLCNVHLHANGDPLALKLRLMRLLDTTDFGVASLPAEACLVVRHLGDPLPGTLRLGQDALLPPAAWQRAMRQALASQARQAARPALGPVPADAPAVLFADRAELLACLATDSLAGLLPARWWWRSLFPNANLPQAALAAWQDSPEHLPAVLELLARRGQAPAFIRALDNATTLIFLSGLLKTFGLAALRLVFETPLVAANSGATPTQAILAEPTAPWPFPMPASANLTVNGQTLLGIALTLRHTPALARTRQFAEDVRRWREAVFEIQASSLPGRPSPTAAETWSESQEGQAHKQPDAAAQPQTLIGFGNATSAKFALPDAEPPTFIPAQVAATPAGLSQTSIPRADLESEPGRRDPIEPDSGPASDFAAIIPESGASLFTPLQGEALLVETIQTQFGGIFYLLNLALLLEFYGDFSLPATQELALSPWDFLALVGRELVGLELERDPLWLLLARLAGRQVGQPPGWGFEPPDELALADWVEQITAKVRLRLVVALRLEQEAVLRDLFFAHPARIEQASSRLDIFFSLVEHPVQIRMAGLDRDPWWIPAAGRFVAYHYD